jgi:hypothetical protein
LIKKIFSCLLVTLVFISVHGQNTFSGNWYTFVARHILEVSFSKDSLCFKLLNWNLSPVKEQDRTSCGRIKRIIHANNSEYILLKDPDDSIEICTFKIITPAKKILWVRNGSEDRFPDNDSVAFILKDTSKKFGLAFYSQPEVNKIRHLKSIDIMSIKDFKKFGNNLLNESNKIAALISEKIKQSDLATYGYFCIKESLLETGYNPFVPDKKLNNMFIRFEKNPATSKLAKEIYK